MANTTFNGPVRSQNGFQQITTNGTTGAVTQNQFEIQTVLKSPRRNNHLTIFEKNYVG